MIEKGFCPCPQILWITLWANWGGAAQALDSSGYPAGLPHFSARTGFEQNQALSGHQGKSEWSNGRAFRRCAAA
jgi:hypothetical protein